MFPKWLNASFKLSYCYIKRHAFHICFTIKGVDSLAFFSDILWDLTRSVFLVVLALAKSVRRWFVVKRKNPLGNLFSSNILAPTCVTGIKAFSNSSANFPQFFPLPAGVCSDREVHTDSADCVQRRNQYLHSLPTVGLRTIPSLPGGTKYAPNTSTNSVEE